MFLWYSRKSLTCWRMLWRKSWCFCLRLFSASNFCAFSSFSVKRASRRFWEQDKCFFGWKRCFARDVPDAWRACTLWRSERSQVSCPVALQTRLPDEVASESLKNIENRWRTRRNKFLKQKQKTTNSATNLTKAGLTEQPQSLQFDGRFHAEIVRDVGRYVFKLDDSLRNTRFDPVFEASG